MKQQYVQTVIYHTNPEQRKKFQKEILSRFASLSEFGRETIKNPKEVFKI